MVVRISDGKGFTLHALGEDPFTAEEGDGGRALRISERGLALGDHQFSGPRWSPDGRQLAFISNRADTAQIYLMPSTEGNRPFYAKYGFAVVGTEMRMTLR